ncbi:MAG: DUF1854 domain-containing protein [Fimbriimonadaceae bacterium]|nr:DUF1854 domain-containing protein [Fimbriimonadaceae bacterium]
MNLQDIKLFFEPKDRLRMTYDDRSWVTVKPAWASPLTYPNRFLSLMNAKGEEIVMVPDLDALSEESRVAAETEVARRYLTAKVLRIDKAKSEFGATYWHVQTDRGERDFVTQSLQENAQWLGPAHLLLIDVDGNRFELEDVQRLDAQSRALLDQVV